LEAGRNVITLFKNRGWDAIVADDLIWQCPIPRIDSCRKLLQVALHCTVHTISVAIRYTILTIQYYNKYNGHVQYSDIPVN
jgi:hypothetical protein